MTIGALFGVAGAWPPAAVVSDAAIRLAVGLIGISFVLNAWFRRAPGTGKPTAAGGIVWGALSGFTSTIIQAGAPPFQVFVLPQRLPKMTLVGTMTIFFALVNIMKVAPYLALGQFSPATLATSAILLPIAVAANFAGIWLVRVTSLETFYRLAYWLVLVISAVLAWQGAADLMRS
ncbi:MAG TPA: sulfite exporter TauE/SafE family protein [Xanthobacteraceae bacterium]|nr:sulfite exporter TauE/SafE family protein [Xanthobacteraceae bacterium]